MTTAGAVPIDRCRPSALGSNTRDTQRGPSRHTEKSSRYRTRPFHDEHVHISVALNVPLIIINSEYRLISVLKENRVLLIREKALHVILIAISYMDFFVFSIQKGSS